MLPPRLLSRLKDKLDDKNIKYNYNATRLLEAVTLARHNHLDCGFTIILIVSRMFESSQLS